MTLAAGAIFGLVWGLGMVSFASTLGATLAMLISRTLLRDWVQGRFASQLRAVNEGFDTDGAFYLFSIRMVPLFPFFIVNLVDGADSCFSAGSTTGSARWACWRVPSCMCLPAHSLRESKRWGMS